MEGAPQYRESWVRFPPGAGLFKDLSDLSKVSLNRSLKEVQHYCFSYENVSLAVQLGAKEA